MLTLDVAFAQAPDFDPQTIEYGSKVKVVEYAGYPSIDVPFYQKGMGLDLGVLGDPRTLLALPYPSHDADHVRATGRSSANAWTPRTHRFVVLPRPGVDQHEQLPGGVRHQRDDVRLQHEDSVRKPLRRDHADVRVRDVGRGASRAASPGV